MKKIVIAVVAVIVIILIAGGLLLWKRKNDAANAAKTQQKTVAVQRGNIIRNVQATGLVASKLDVEIKCKASGQIISLPFDISAKVKKGDLLLQLDPTDENRNVEKARENLLQAQSRFDQSSSDLSTTEKNLSNTKLSAKVNLDSAKIKADDIKTQEDRTKQLYEQKLVSKEEYDAAHTAATQAKAAYDQTGLTLDQLKTQAEALEVKRQALKIAQADVESAKIDLTIAQQRLIETKVYSPLDGTITTLNVQTGQIISSGINNVGGGTTIMIVSDISRLYILAAIDESDIGDIKIGQPVVITADAFPQQKFKGIVDRIAQKGTNTSNVVTFEVRIEVTSNNKVLLKPEMTANVEIIIEEKDNVLYVPASAVYNEDVKQAEEAAVVGKTNQPAATAPVVRGKRAAGASSAGGPTGGGARKLKLYVTVVTGGTKTEAREVETGTTDGNNIEIISGLKEGEMVETREDVVTSKFSSPAGNRGGGGGGGAGGFRGGGGMGLGH